MIETRAASTQIITVSIDQYILDVVTFIEKQTVPDAWKYHALDRFYFIVANHHPHGWAADVLESIARAMDKY